MCNSAYPASPPKLKKTNLGTNSLHWKWSLLRDNGYSTLETSNCMTNLVSLSSSCQFLVKKYIVNDGKTTFVMFCDVTKAPDPLPRIKGPFWKPEFWSIFKIVFGRRVFDDQKTREKFLWRKSVKIRRNSVVWKFPVSRSLSFDTNCVFLKIWLTWNPRLL